jgi:hypothetical protein
MTHRARRAGWQASAGLAAVMVLGITQAHAAPVNVILDTDIGPDCDDVAAVALLHGLANRGEARLLAMMCCISSEWGAPCLDALNTYYGRPGIPVGTLKEPGFHDGKSYNQEVARHLPHALASGKDAPDAVALYRSVLAKQPDGSVVVVAVGPLKNLANLLASGPDAASPLGGRDLVARKVSRLVCMGGRYPSGKEWNFEQDGAAAKRVAGEWPTEILFSGSEIGGGLCTGRRVALEAPEHNPLTLAFAHYPDVGFGGDRLSWDPTACLSAVRGAGDSWKTVSGGTNVVEANGANAWKEAPGGRHAYLAQKMAAGALEDAMEDLMVAAKPGPVTFDYNTAYYVREGMGLVTARGEASPRQGPRAAMDRDPRTAWLDNAAASWIRLQYPDGKRYAVARYTLTSGDGDPALAPAAWTLSGSNDDGATWKALDARSKESFGRLQERDFAVAAPAAYNLYRLEVTSSGGAVQLAEWALLERVEAVAGAAVTGLRLDPATFSIPVDGRAAVHVTVLPAKAADKGVAWSTSDTAVAVVRRIGKGTALVAGRGAGTCTVTATSDDGARKATCQVTVRPTTLLAPWAFQEVNAPYIPGGVLFADGRFAVTGAGVDIWQWWQRVRDQFAYVSQKRTGDCALSARIVSQADTSAKPYAHARAKAGLMLRETADPGSKYVMLVVSPPKEPSSSRDLLLFARDATNQEMVDRNWKKVGTVALPVHLKLEKKGSAFEAYTSADGKDWGAPCGSRTVTFAENYLAGMAVTSANAPTSSTAVFESVEVR